MLLVNPVMNGQFCKGIIRKDREIVNFPIIPLSNLTVKRFESCDISKSVL